MQKPLGNKNVMDGPTDRRTDLPTDTARCRVACPQLKMVSKENTESRKGGKKEVDRKETRRAGEQGQ